MYVCYIACIHVYKSLSSKIPSSPLPPCDLANSLLDHPYLLIAAALHRICLSIPLPLCVHTNYLYYLISEEGEQEAVLVVVVVVVVVVGIITAGLLVRLLLLPR